MYLMYIHMLPAFAGAGTMLGLHDFLPLSSVSARDLEVEIPEGSAKNYKVGPKPIVINGV